MVELDLKFHENKEGTFINQYNDEVIIRLTNEYNKLCVFFEINNVDIIINQHKKNLNNM